MLLLLLHCFVFAKTISKYVTLSYKYVTEICLHPWFLATCTVLGSTISSYIFTYTLPTHLKYASFFAYEKLPLPPSVASFRKNGMRSHDSRHTVLRLLFKNLSPKTDMATIKEYYES